MKRITIDLPDYVHSVQITIKDTARVCQNKTKTIHDEERQTNVVYNGREWIDKFICPKCGLDIGGPSLSRCPRCGERVKERWYAGEDDHD